MANLAKSSTQSSQLSADHQSATPLTALSFITSGSKFGKAAIILQFISFVQSDPSCLAIFVLLILPASPIRGATMRRQQVWIGCLFLCLGCHSLANVEQEPKLTAQREKNAEHDAKELWRQGQLAMKQGKPRRAIDYYEQSMTVDSNFSRNHLSMAAAHLEEGNEDAACVQLARYIEKNPDRAHLRLLYGELLLRQDRIDEAQSQITRFVAHAQEEGDRTLRSRIQCHCRLMEMAEKKDSSYHAHLERGIGLYLLARRSRELGLTDGFASSRSLLWKSHGELATAQSLRPDQARPCWYLHRVWSEIASKKNASKWLEKTSDLASFSFLTPAEHRSLQLACRQAKQPTFRLIRTR